MVQAFLPLMILPLISTIERIPHDYEKAAMSLGATRLVVWRRVLLPLMLPGIVAGSLLVFCASLTAFVTPQILGQGKVVTFASLAYQQAAMPKKAFGVFRHKLVGPQTPWLHGFSDSPMIPVSRYNDIDRTSLGKHLDILIDNDEIGVCMLADKARHALYMLNHLEYDNRSLADEYERDVKAGLDTAPPVNLFPNGDTSAEPENRWRSHVCAVLRLPDHRHISTPSHIS